MINIDTLAYAIYSVNKHAKNHRDALLYTYDKDYTNNEYAMLYLYDLKEQVLKTFKPKQIHIQKTNKKIYKLIPEGSDSFKNAKGKAKILFDENTGTYKRYKKSSIKEKKILYYLYYELGNFKYHLPISEEEAKTFKDLAIMNLPGDFYMPGADPVLLMDEKEAIDILVDYLDSTK